MTAVTEKFFPLFAAVDGDNRGPNNVLRRFKTNARKTEIQKARANDIYHYYQPFMYLIEDTRKWEMLPVTSPLIAGIYEFVPTAPSHSLESWSFIGQLIQWWPNSPWPTSQKRAGDDGAKEIVTRFLRGSERGPDYLYIPPRSRDSSVAPFDG